MNALPRLVSGALADQLAVMPAVVVTGARQTGKSTLAEQLVQGKRLYARWTTSTCSMPRGVERAIDRNRSAGRFLLTGSANLLFMRQVSESLAGRAAAAFGFSCQLRKRIKLAPNALGSALPRA